MALETATFINDLNAANPTASDPKSQGDDQIRMLKSVLKASWTQIAGAVNATHTQLNYMVGVTSPLQAQIDLKQNIADAVTYAYVNGLVLTSALPGQTGSAGKVITTDGTTPSWADPASFNDVLAPDVATSAAPDIWSGIGSTKLLTGSVAVTGFTAAPRAGAKRKLIAATGFYMIQGANLTIKGGSITLAAGDEVDVLALTTMTFRATVTRADGTAIINKVVHYDAGTTNTLNYLNGESQRWAPASGAKTLTVTGWPPPGIYASLRIKGVNLAAGGIPTVTGATYIKYDGSYQTTAALANITFQTAGTDYVLLFTDDGGATMFVKVMR
ncbi:Glycoprotein gp2 [Janthinobacterium sp. CG23_2]|nr:Glycoprotein gp2 [Janthinobacterium sp. CG23_2]CUU27664.1 Glycoprotein gp2 [Janthinobacterium sp. CG23_2]